jgi:hypothetical protein
MQLWTKKASWGVSNLAGGCVLQDFKELSEIDEKFSVLAGWDVASDMC